MKKTFITMTAVAVVGFGSVTFGGAAHAESISDLKSKQTEIKHDRSSIKANLSDAEGQIADVLIDLDELNTEIDRVKSALKQNEDKMSATKSDISKTKQKVDALEAEIKKLEDAIEKRYDILKERIVSYQKSGGNITYLEVVFGSKSFGDFISRVSAVNKIADSDTSLMEKQEKDKAEVEDKQDEVKAKLDELNELKLDLEGMIATIEDQKKVNETKKSKLKAKENDLIALKEDLQIKDSSLASLESEVRQSIEIANRPAPVTAVAAETTSRSESAGSKTSEPVVNDSHASHHTEASETSEPSSTGKTKKTSTNHNDNVTQVRSEKPKKKKVIKEKNTASSSVVSSNTNKVKNKSNESKSSNTKSSNTKSVSTVATTGSGVNAAISAGNTQKGTPYVWGGKGTSGFDCSGFVSWAFGEAGYSIPSSTSALVSVGTKVSPSNMQVGDLVFFDTEGRPNGHVGIYLGGGSFLGAQTSTGVAVASMSSGYWKNAFNGNVRRVK